MFKIIHISDLHFVSDGAAGKRRSLLQRLFKTLSPGVGLHMATQHRNRQTELRIVCKQLRPNMIIATGDLSDRGDICSLELAREYLLELRDFCGAEHVLCVPGNHDVLSGRVQKLRKNPFWRIVLWGFSFFSKELSVIRDESKKLESKRTARAASILDQYSFVFCDPFPPVDPRHPVPIPTVWGEVLVFLFDSVSVEGMMANEGQVAREDFTAVRDWRVGIDGQQTRESRFDSAVKIALLHHHPMGAPHSNAGALDRFYNAMRDGGAFLDVMNDLGFHFVLHGHEHRPFSCEITYGSRPGPPLRVLAAGSSLHGEDDDKNISFNVIEIAPFFARKQRFSLRPNLGFKAVPDEESSFSIRPYESVRLPKTEPDVDDPRASSLQLACRSVAEAFDDEHEYELLDFRVKVDSDETYHGKYRRKGKVVSEKSNGIPFIIVGSPACSFNDLNIEVKSLDPSSGAVNSLYVEPPLLDEPNRKVFRVLRNDPLKEGDEFDIEMSFTWPVTPADPNDYDGFNLSYFRYKVKEVRYQIELPTRPSSPPELYSIALTDEEEEIVPFQTPPNKMHINFKIINPRHSVYCLWLGDRR